MKDADSAKFGTIAASRNTKGAVSVCGYVNGKNSYGGYTGEQPFIGVLFDRPNIPLDKRFVLAWGFGSSPKVANAILQMCYKSGVRI